MGKLKVPVQFLANIAAIELSGRGPNGPDPRGPRALARMGRAAGMDRVQVRQTLLASGGDPGVVDAAIENAFGLSEILVEAKVRAAMNTLFRQQEKITSMEGCNRDEDGFDDADRYASIVIRIVGED